MKEQLIAQMNFTSQFLQDLPVVEIDGNKLLKGGKEFNLITIVGDVTVDKKLTEGYNVTEGFHNPLKSNQIISEMRSIGRKYMDIITNGKKENLYEFDGISSLVDSINVFDCENASDMKDTLFSKFKPDFILIRGGDFHLLRDEIEVKDGSLYFRGVKVYLGDYIRPYYSAFWRKLLYWLSTKVRWVKAPKYDTTVVYSGKFGEKGIFGIRAKGNYPELRYIGPSQYVGDITYRLKAYLGFGCGDGKSLVKVMVRV